MTDKLSDQWQTPGWLFDELNKQFNFDIDLCATKENSKCSSYCIDYLLEDFSSYDREDNIICFMNPPYSNPRPFIEKAWEDSKHCKIVCLVKCDPSTKWWATFWEYGENIRCVRCMHIEKSDIDPPGNDQCDIDGCDYASYHGPKPGCGVRFFPKRIKFDPPHQLIESGEIWKFNDAWVERCKKCSEGWIHKVPHVINSSIICSNCKGKGYKKLSGPTFPSALIIMDRRN